MKLTYLLLIASFSFSYARAQDLVIEWQNNIGGTDYDNPVEIMQTPDGNYICAGGSNSDASGDKSEDVVGAEDYWIMKLDNTGAIIWEESFGGSNYEEPAGALLTSDGGTVLTGISRSNASGDKSEDKLGELDVWVIKVDSDGNLEWENTIGGDGEEVGISLIETADGDIVIGGHSNSNISGDKSEDSFGHHDYWIVKLDEFGTVLWDRTIGGDSADVLAKIEPTSDGGFILLGSSFSEVSGHKTEPNIGIYGDLWVVRIDADGNYIWDKTIGGDHSDGARDIIETLDGGYIIAAVSHSGISGNKTEENRGSMDCWVIKIDQVGNVEWDKTVGGTDLDASSVIVQTTDGNYMLGAYSASNISFEKTDTTRGFLDYWIVNISESGTVLWDKTYGGTESDILIDIIQTEDQGYALCGYSSSPASGDKDEDMIPGSLTYSHDYWIVKLKDCDLLITTVNQEGITLIAEIDDATYQWVDCDNDFEPIDGATEQSFTPIENGNYAVIISDGLCEKMSDCFSITTLTLSNNSPDQILIYPNPVKDILTVQVNGNPVHTVIQDITGKLLLDSYSSQIDVSNLSNGVYFLNLYHADGALISTKKIAKE